MCDRYTPEEVRGTECSVKDLRSVLRGGGPGVSVGWRGRRVVLEGYREVDTQTGRGYLVRVL